MVIVAVVELGFKTKVPRFNPDSNLGFNTIEPEFQIWVPVWTTALFERTLFRFHVSFAECIRFSWASGFQAPQSAVALRAGFEAEAAYNRSLHAHPFKRSMSNTWTFSLVVTFSEGILTSK